MGATIRTLILAALALSIAAASHAETRYIRDLVLVNLRAAPDSGSEAVKLMRTGDKFEIISEDDSYVFVRIDSGEEGWLPKQYTTPEAPSRLLLSQVRAQLTGTTAKLEEAQRLRQRAEDALDEARKMLKKGAVSESKTLKEQRAEVAGLTKELGKLKKDHAELLDKSGRALEISAERDRMAKELAAIKEKLLVSDEAMEGLTKMAALKWFLGGALVLVVGWGIGVATGRKKKAKAYR